MEEGLVNTVRNERRAARDETVRPRMQATPGRPTCASSRSALATAVALAPDGLVERSHLVSTIGSPSWTDLPLEVRGSSPCLPRAGTVPGQASLRSRLEELPAAHDGNVAAVARVMGKGRMQIHRWARRFGIDLREFRR